MGAVSSSRENSARSRARETIDDDMDKENQGREKCETWILLSNGPSLRRIDAFHNPHDFPTVAVNHAIMHKTIRADVWSVHENHMGIWEGLILKAHGPSRARLGETWIASGHIDNWRTAVRAERSKRRLPELDLVPHYNRTRDWAWRQKPWPDSKVRWGDRTVFATIGHMVLRGAKRILCYGVDMEGSHNFGNEVCQEELRRAHGRVGSVLWNERWDFERSVWAIMEKEATDHGVEIERMTP